MDCFNSLFTPGTQSFYGWVLVVAMVFLVVFSLVTLFGEVF
jgi:hypothetical protein